MMLPKIYDEPGKGFTNYQFTNYEAGYLIFSFTNHGRLVFSFWSDYYSSVQPERKYR